MNFLRGLFLSVSLLCASAIYAATDAPKPVNVQDATLAVYHGKQVCEYSVVDGFFGPMAQWGCKFKSDFICTATITDGGQGQYVGLTAGHCFDWNKENEYYVSSELNSNPVLKKIKLVKFEDSDRYDFAIFEFESIREYPAIPIGNILPEVGTVITNTNFALGLVKQQVEGKVVSGLILTPPFKELAGIKGRYLVSIGTGPGASGSAIVVNGKIVGIVEAIVPGTQMPTIVMPTGETLLNFMDDDSAGLKPQPEPKKPAGTPGLPESDSRLVAWFKLLWRLL